MERPKFPKSLNEHNTNKTTHKIGQDMRGIVPYNFNNCGFRADTDYIETEQNAGCFFGHAFTSAVGLEWHSSYASLTCKELSAKCYNFSQGCVGVDNFEIIRTAIDIANMETFKPKFYVIQFCDLIRRFNPKNKRLSFESDIDKNVDEFVNAFKKLEDALKNETWLFLGHDFVAPHPLPDYITKHKNCLIWNPNFFDKILYGMPGEKWHNIISYGLVKRFKDEQLEKISWRQQQQNFASEKVEFAQDQRILEFFNDSPVLGIGDVKYFKNKII